MLSCTLLRISVFADLFHFMRSYYLQSLVFTVVDVVSYFDLSVFIGVFYGRKATTP